MPLFEGRELSQDWIDSILRVRKQNEQVATKRLLTAVEAVIAEIEGHIDNEENGGHDWDIDDAGKTYHWVCSKCHEQRPYPDPTNGAGACRENTNT